MSSDRGGFFAIDGGEGADTTPPLEQRRTIDLEAQTQTLGYLLGFDGAIDEVPFLRAEHFDASERDKQTFIAILALRDKGDAISAASVDSHLRRTGRLAQVGPDYLPDLVERTRIFSRAHLLTHARRVRDLWVRRQLKLAGDRLRVRTEHDHADETTLVAETKELLEELSVVLAQDQQSCRADAVVNRTLAEVEALHVSGGPQRLTGFAIDQITAGLHNEVVIVGGRPGMAKTAFGCAIAVNLARAGEGVMIASLETSPTSLMTRIVCAEGGVDVHRARAGKLSADDWTRFVDACARISSLPLFIDDQSAMSVSELWAKARRYQLELARTKQTLGLVVVDYVQLLRAPRGGMAREQVVSENIRTIRAMALDLRVSVIGLAQLNREVEKRKDKRPQLSDLRESGEFEQCARAVMLLYRGDYYAQRGPGYEPTGIVEVHVAKQNDGPTGVMRLHFDESSLAFSNPPQGWPARERAHAPSCPCAECQAGAVQ